MPHDPKRVVELEDGDDTADYGPVTHREGRRVWFDDRIITYPSGDDEVELDDTEDERDNPPRRRHPSIW